MLEKCFPFAYILVDKHPCRHDPSHLVTHRVQSNIVQFADCVLKSRFPWRRSKLHGHLQALDGAVCSPDKPCTYNALKIEHDRFQYTGNICFPVDCMTGSFSDADCPGNVISNIC